jgi:hypothetical protein
MGSLPSEAEQEGLLRDLAELIASRGSAAFLTAPIVEPSPRYLPDEWTGDLAGTQALLRRLMLYAGLDLDAHLHVYDGEEPRDSRHAIAWFAGIEGNRCLFGLDVRQLDDPQILIAALCHEVAHAYRHRHGLVKADRDREEQLTDLTTVFLGFGIFNTNAADRFRQSAWVIGNVQHTERSLRQAGYLPVEHMCFLLAAQIVARDLPPRRIKDLTKLLEINQAEYLSRGVGHLAKRRTELLTALGLPPDIAGLEEPDLDRFTRPLTAWRKVELTADPVSSEPATAGPTEGWTVYALREGGTRYLLLCVFGAGVGTVLHTFLALFIDTFVLFAPLVFGGAILFPLLLGGRWRYVCSDTACGKRIPSGSEACPGCGVRISRWIKSKKEIYENDETRFEE